MSKHGLSSSQDRRAILHCQFIRHHGQSSSQDGRPSQISIGQLDYTARYAQDTVDCSQNTVEHAGRTAGRDLNESHRKDLSVGIFLKDHFHIFIS